MNRSFADVDDQRQLGTALSALNSAQELESENTAELTGRGRSYYLEHETGLEPATPTLAISFNAIPS